MNNQSEQQPEQGQNFLLQQSNQPRNNIMNQSGSSSVNNPQIEQTIKKNLEEVYENRDNMNAQYLDLLEKEQNLRFQLWKQQMDQMKNAQNQNADSENKYNKNMGMIAHLTNNTLPVVQSPFNNLFANPLSTTGIGAGGGQMPGTPNYNAGFTTVQKTGMGGFPGVGQTQQQQQQAQRSPDGKFNEQYLREIREKEQEILSLKSEIAQTKIQYEEIFQKHNKDQQDRFQNQLQLAEQENQNIKKQYEMELEMKKRELKSGQQLYEELAQRHKMAIENKDKEMNEFIQYKYKPLENKVEVLKEENIVSENKVNVTHKDEFKKQQDDVRKMQIFIMSQKQELENLRKTAHDYDQMRRTNQMPTNNLISSKSQQNPVFQENQTNLLEKIDNLTQLLQIEKQKNKDLTDQQKNVQQVNRQLFLSPASSDKDINEQIMALKRENEALKLLTVEYKPNFVVKKKKQDGNFLQQKGKQIDTDKLISSQNPKKTDNNKEDEQNSSYISIHSASLQQTPFQKQSQYEEDNNNNNNNPHQINLDYEEIDEPECIRQNNILREQLTNMLKRNEMLQLGLQSQLDQGQMQGGGGGSNEVVTILQEKLVLMKEKYESLQKQNRVLQQAFEGQIENDDQLVLKNNLNSSQNSLNNSYTNLNAKNLKVENQKLKAYLQLKINELEEFKVKGMRHDQLQDENIILDGELQKARLALNTQNLNKSQQGNQQQYSSLMQVKDMEIRNQMLQQELQKVTNVLREKMQENELIKGQAIGIQKHAKENIFNMERSYKDNYLQMEKSFRENQNRQQVVNKELDKVTHVLRGKMKESDELKAAISQFDSLMKEKHAQNDQLARKCQQLAAALQQKVQNEQKVQEVFRQNEQMKQDQEKLMNALKEKLRENENIKGNFRKLEQYLREREVIEGELRKMKDILDQKLRETGEWRNRCQQMEGRIRQTNELEGKMRDLQGKMRFVLQEITSIPNKIGGF